MLFTTRNSTEKEGSYKIITRVTSKSTNWKNIFWKNIIVLEIYLIS